MGRAFHEALRSRGVPTEMVVYPRLRNRDHDFCSAYRDLWPPVVKDRVQPELGLLGAG